MKEKQKEIEKGKAGTASGYKPGQALAGGCCYHTHYHLLPPPSNTSADTLMSLSSVAVLIKPGLRGKAFSSLTKAFCPERPLRKCEPVSRCSTAFK